MWLETDCSNPDCDHTYRWHRELRNVCPTCKWDLGFMIDWPITCTKCLAPLGECDCE